MLTTNATLWPMIAHAALVFFLYWRLSVKRVAAVRSGRVQASQFRESLQEPADSLLIHNNLKNQFELPVLFYAVCLALFVTTADNIGTLILSWIFVLSRCIHTYVHITSNRLRYRRPLFMFGFFITVALWVWLAIWLALN